MLEKISESIQLYSKQFTIFYSCICISEITKSYNFKIFFRIHLFSQHSLKGQVLEHLCECHRQHLSFCSESFDGVFTECWEASNVAEKHKKCPALLCFNSPSKPCLFALVFGGVFNGKTVLYKIPGKADRNACVIVSASVKQLFFYSH